MLCAVSSDTALYATSAGTSPPAVDASRHESGTNTPLQQPKRSGPSGVGPKATGCGVHVARSSLLTCPQAMSPCTAAAGLCW